MFFVFVQFEWTLFTVKKSESESDHESYGISSVLRLIHKAQKRKFAFMIVVYSLTFFAFAPTVGWCENAVNYTALSPIHTERKRRRKFYLMFVFYYRPQGKVMFLLMSVVGGGYGVTSCLVHVLGGLPCERGSGQTPLLADTPLPRRRQNPLVGRSPEMGRPP